MVVLGEVTAEAYRIVIIEHLEYDVCRAASYLPLLTRLRISHQLSNSKGNDYGWAR